MTFYQFKTCKTFVELKQIRVQINWIKSSNSFDGMVACKWQDSIDLYKFEISDILEDGYIEHNDLFSTNLNLDVSEASVDDESRIF